jgi:hypothetical protein
MNAALDSHHEREHRMTDPMTIQQFYHGTRADLQPGDLIAAGYVSNYGARKQAPWVYLTGTMDAAIWGAELAMGEGRERIYIVAPTGEIVDDPNLTDRKFPGNPTLSYRSRAALRVTGEVTEWEGHSPERLQQMKDFLARLKAEGVEAID